MGVSEAKSAKTFPQPISSAIDFRFFVLTRQLLCFRVLTPASFPVVDELDINHPGRTDAEVIPGSRYRYHDPIAPAPGELALLCPILTNVNH